MPQVALPVILIQALKKCSKCAACEAMVARLQEQFPGQLDYETFPADDPRAEEYGVIMPPMLIIAGFLLSAGNVPREEAVVAFVRQKLTGPE